MLGQSEEFNLLKKVLKEELQEGIYCQIIDDVYVGGQTQGETANNYICILHKLALANLKVSASKTFIFPEQADILGWVWKQGGKLEPSPHRRNALANTNIDYIKKVKDMHSWLGLYKTWHRATPNIYQLLKPFEEAVASIDSKEDFTWTHELQMRFREAKSLLPNLPTLYLPAPHDQLILKPDGACSPPGIGHVLLAIKNGEKIPVCFHSVKLPEGCTHWSPCEIEALSFTIGIEAEYNLIRV